MSNINGLKISICQMNVIPGHPDVNSNYIIGEIKSAHARGNDLIVFSEMCVPGYLLGDKFEDDYFIDDILRSNSRIIESTPAGIAAIFGTVTVSRGTGEDGRKRKHNSAVISSDGKIVAVNYKTLQPNYRFFNDDKHFYSVRKIAEESSERWRKTGGREGRLFSSPNEYLKPIFINTSIGCVCIGVILCEDMWHLDYAFDPARILMEKGANIVFNLSASPWTWQKNRKRHQVVRNILKDCSVPFVYVNNTGVQSIGKNIVVFDGSSTVYNKHGNIVLEVSPYAQGSFDAILSDTMKIVGVNPPSDTKELYDAMICATKSMVPPDTKVVVGLSGGIDSATVAAHMVDAFGRDKVIGVNMPFRNMNSPQTRAMAKTISENLGIQYIVQPIDLTVDAIAGLDITPNDFEYENIQAFARMTVLARIAKKYGGRFTSNSNKVEIAFGYGTLYGDIAGFYAPLGDLVKREVRQIANYLNVERFKREVIPIACINQVATAELRKNQRDPFDYGDLTRRGYHDEMVRAYTEFRKNPEWFLEMYLLGKLEPELKLDRGTLIQLFPTDADFVRDLEHWWIKFQDSYFKRIQSPPIPIFSRRAFGRDLEESLVTSQFTQRYYELKQRLNPESYTSEHVQTQNFITLRRPRIAIYGTKANPPGLHHKLIVEELARQFDLVIIVPCGFREDQPHVLLAPSLHRKKMALLNFGGIANVEFDFYDLDNNVFTPTYMLAERYQEKYPEADIVFIVGADLISGGQNDNSEIQTKWQMGGHIWQNLKYAVINTLNTRDLPPNSEIIDVSEVTGRSTLIREKIANDESIAGLALKSVEEYIRSNNLYT